MTSMQKTKNDAAWEQIFDKYNIVNQVEKQGFLEITSEQINEFREARLMTKFDHKSNLPQLFQKHRLSILPITRGSYAIAPFEAYHRLEKQEMKIHKVGFPDYIQGIDYGNITSEATAINTAYVSGIFADFSEDEKLLPTVSGRMSSNKFDFYINNTIHGGKIPLSVLNSQMEIDGGYEGMSSLMLIEAKNSISEDFLIRQLYYPYRLWQNHLQKPVRPVFLIYSNGVFSLYEYSFEELVNYNSLVLIKQKNYTIEPEEITLGDIVEIFHRVECVSEPTGIPFPQADSFRRVINLCELLYENSTLSREEITYQYDFDVRQTNYYTDAGRYLGLVDKEREAGAVKYTLTEKGRNLFCTSIRTRNLKLAEWILAHKPFYLTFKRYLEYHRMPPKNEVVQIMKVSDLYNIESQSTFFRRASTLSGWLGWIIDLLR